MGVKTTDHRWRARSIRVLPILLALGLAGCTSYVVKSQQYGKPAAQPRLLVVQSPYLAGATKFNSTLTTALRQCGITAEVVDGVPTNAPPVRKGYGPATGAVPTFAAPGPIPAGLRDYLVLSLVKTHVTVFSEVSISPQNAGNYDHYHVSLMEPPSNKVLWDSDLWVQDMSQAAPCYGCIFRQSDARDDGNELIRVTLNQMLDDHVIQGCAIH